MPVPSATRQTAIGSGPAPRRPGGRSPRFPYLLATIAVFWLAAIVLPSLAPNESGSSYLGAAILAVAAGTVGVVAASRLRTLYASDSRPGLVATPVIVYAIVSVILGALAFIFQGPSQVLSQGFAWMAELGGLATVISLVPMAGSDGARIVHAVIAKRRGEEAASKADATVAVRAGIAVIALGVVLLLAVDLGLGLAAMLLGWFSLGNGRLGRARQTLAAQLSGASVGDVVVPSTPLPGWRTLDDVLAAGSWPVGVTALPVVGWAGESAGVLMMAVADRALAGGQGDTRVDRLAVPAALVPIVDAADPAASLVAVLGGTVAGVAVVTSRGQVVGAITTADLALAAAPTRRRSRHTTPVASA